MQVAALLQLSKVHADLHHMEQLNIQLSQATGEVQFLTGKLHESEEREVKFTKHIELKDLLSLHNAPIYLCKSMSTI